MNVKIRQLPHGHGLPLPEYASEGSAGLDLYAALEREIIIRPGAVFLAPTGISIALNPGFEGQVRPRSGLAAKKMIGIVNSPGTIDSDYRGEILAPLINLSDNDFILKRGDRIAQLVITRYEKIKWEAVNDLPESKRGAGGFGHSGR